MLAGSARWSGNENELGTSPRGGRACHIHCRSAAGPVAGQTVSFASGSSAACVAVTDASGVATCSVDYGVLATLLGIVFPGTPFTPPAVGAGFTATYAGDGGHQGSSGGGAITAG